MAYYNRANAYKELLKLDLALLDYDQSIKYDATHKSKSAYLNRGLVRTETLDYEEAIQDFTMSIELDPHDEKAFNNLGVAYYKLSDYNAAL